VKRLQQLRLDAHLSLDELDALSGVSSEQIRRIEAGTTTNPRVPTLVALATALNAKPSELLMDALPPMHTDEPKAAA
jgi:transcriptional regulator with XRE-family HTH domain